MNLEDLIANGGLVPETPVKRSAIWNKKNEAGEDVELQFDVFVKKHSFGTIEKIWNDDGDRSKSAAYISQSIRLGENGKQQLSYEQAFQLDPGLATVLIGVINEVNGTGGGDPKN